jgi:dimethylamine/trimethylamine dehydrogenase
VTALQPNDQLYRALAARSEAGAAGAPRTLIRIGDCDAPAIIAAAVYAGHRYARELDAGEVAPARRDRVVPGEF